MRLLVLTLFAALLASCAQPTRQVREPAPDEPALRVMTYNVNYGVAGDEPTIGVIAHSGADIVFVQETTPEWQAHLEGLEDTYPHQYFHHCCGAGGFAFLSKYPFEADVIDAHPDSWFPAGLAVFDTPLGKVQGLNVHLRPPFSDDGSIVSGYVTTPAVREAEIEHFTAHLDDDLPLIVAGDFNEDASGGALAKLEARGLRNALEEFDPGADTWRWNTSFGEVSSQLDHVAYTPGLEPIAAEVRPHGNSDHYPIIAVFVRDEPR